MEPRAIRLVVAVVIALALGFVAGYVFRRHTHPTLEERAQDAAEELKSAVERLTK
jgi:uncharacterized membrane protein YraQ (UPF0718 family)